MIKLLIKLAVAALVANALYRIGSEYLTFVRFRDDVRASAIYRAKTDDELNRRIMALAAEYDIPLVSRNVTIARAGDRLTVNAAYHKPIEVVPQYPVQWPFDVSLEVQIASPSTLPGGPFR
jgi:hypothetical protein